MTEIKRYEVNKANMIGLVRFDEKESGRWVKHEDHAAIVAALQEQLSRYSMSAGQADQRKAESDAVRSALGFSADADDVSPSDLLEKIAALQEQVQALVAERDGSLKAIADIYMAVIGGRPGWSNWHAYLGDIVEEVATALREIRAQEIESLSGVAETMLVKFANQNASKIPEALAWSMVKCHAEDRATRIRAGDQP